MARFHYIEVEDNDFDKQPLIPDYHAVVTIQICELANDGFFDLRRPDWDFGPKYSPEQHAQLCEKITNHYWYREIALTPPGIWKREFLRKMNEIMPKYMKWYELVNDTQMKIGHTYDFISGDDTKNNREQQTNTANRNVDESINNDEYYKSRNIFSDFPQTQLAGRNQDYASTGNDVEYEKINEHERNNVTRETDNKDATLNGRRDYHEIREHVEDPITLIENITSFDNVDAAIIDEIEPMFSCLLTVNINGW